MKQLLDPYALLPYTIGFASGFICSFVAISYRLLTYWRQRIGAADMSSLPHCSLGYDDGELPAGPDWDAILRDITSDRSGDA